MFNGLFSRGIKCGHTTRLQTYLALIRQSKATFEGWECIIISKKLALNFCSSLILKDHRKVFFKLSVLLDSSHLWFSSPLSSLHEMSYFYLIFLTLWLSCCSLLSAITLDNTLVILSTVAPDAGRYYVQAVNDKNGENKTSQPITLSVESE